MSSPKKVYIVHGYKASAQDHWFPWLANQVRTAGHEAKIVALTDSEQPEFTVWQQDLQRDFQQLDENTIVVAHSLGCLSSLNFLSSHLMQTKIQAGIFVAGFVDTLPALPELSHFIQQAQLNESVLQTKIQTRLVFVSNNDPLVPPPLVIRLRHLLKAQIEEVVQAGHFMQQDGFSEFPQLWQKLEHLLQR